MNPDEMMGAFGSGSSIFGSAEPPMPFHFNAFGNNPIISMLGNMAAAPLFGAAGLMPGQFNPTQNTADQVMNSAYWRDRNTAVSMAAKSDEAVYKRMLRGAARMSGRPYGFEQEKSARFLASTASSIAPFAQMILGSETFDALHGSRGSAVVMAQGIHNAGRQDVDPITGLTGLSGESAGVMSQSIHDTYFGEGADPSAMKGLSSGRAGMLYQEMRAHGIGHRGFGTMDREEQNMALAADPRMRERLKGRVAGTSTADFAKGVDALRTESPDDFNKLAREFDADKMKRGVERLSGAVAGMRDIFGDAGKPNAPMRELMEGLEMLTQGGLATQSSAKLEQSVRGTQALAKIAGISLPAMQGLMARGAGMADAMGVERPFAVQATQSAVAFGAAFGQSGLSEKPHWQAKSRDEMTLNDQNLTLSASRSGYANQLGASTRIVDSLTASGIEVGAGAKALVAAAKAGKTTYDDPLTGEKGKSVFQDEREWRKTMVASGIDEDTLTRFGRQTETNRQSVFENNYGALVRNGAQGKENAENYARSQRSSISSAIRKAAPGMDSTQAEAYATSAADIIGEAMRSGTYIDADGKEAKLDRRDDTARNKAIAGVMQRKLKADGVEISDKEAILAANAGFADFDKATKLNRLGTGLSRMESTDPVTLKRKAAMIEEGNIASAIRSSLAGLGQAGPLARLSDAIQSPSKDLSGFIGRVFGGVDGDDVQKRLAGLTSLTSDELKVKGISGEDRIKAMSVELVKAAKAAEGARGEKNPEKRAELMKVAQADIEGLTSGGSKAGERIEAIMSAAGLRTSDLNEVLSTNGAFGGMKPADVDRLRALAMAQDKGLMKSSLEEKLSVGASTGLDQTNEVLGGHDRFYKNTKNTEEHARAARAIVESGTRLSEGLISDPASMAALGKGGFDIAKRLHENGMELEALAKKKGKTPAELLASGDPDAEKLRVAMYKDQMEVHRRQTTKAGGIEIMGDDEKKLAADYLTKSVTDDATANRQAIDRLADVTGGKKLSEDERKELAASIGTGKDGKIARFELEKGIKAREGVDALSGAHGWDSAEVRKAIREGRGGEYAAKLKGEERTAFEANAKAAGSVLRAGDEGVSARAYKDSLDDIKKKAEPAATAGSTTAAPATAVPGKLTGTLEMKGLYEAIINATSGAPALAP